jgi:formylglycine-generating enzyme required for sulfatase activity
MDRGGSWGFHAGLCRVADRHGFNPVNLHNALGFRAVRPPGQ